MSKLEIEIFSPENSIQLTGGRCELEFHISSPYSSSQNGQQNELVERVAGLVADVGKLAPWWPTL